MKVTELDFATAMITLVLWIIFLWSGDGIVKIALALGISHICGKVANFYLFGKDHK